MGEGSGQQLANIMMIGLGCYNGAYLVLGKLGVVHILVPVLLYTTLGAGWECLVNCQLKLLHASFTS